MENNFKLSENKKNYIKKLYFSLFHETHSLDKYIKDILGPSKNIDNLTTGDDYQIINDNLYNVNISEKQRANLQKIDPLYLSKLNLSNNITYKEYRNIIQHPEMSTFKFYRIPPMKTFFVTDYSTDYEIGYTFENKNLDSLLKYIKFYDLLVFDFDIELETKEELLTNIKEILPIDMKYSIYETFNGYHVFVTSMRLNHKNNQLIELSRKYKSDQWYTLYSYHYGYSIRLSKKSNRDEKYITRYVCDYGNGTSLEYCLNLINLINDNIELKCFTIDQLNENIVKNNTFYSEYIYNTNIIGRKYYLEKDRVPYTSSAKDYIINKYGKTYESIYIISNNFKTFMNKPHRLLVNHSDYFIAVDLTTLMICIYYKNLMVIDIDFSEDLKNIDEIISFCTKKQIETKDSYIIYSTTNGAHIFVTNRDFIYNSKESVDYMIEHKCDFNYVNFVYNVGWALRLSSKNKEDSFYKLVSKIGDCFEKENLVNIHVELSNKLIDKYKKII